MFYVEHSVIKMMFKSRLAYFGFGYGFGGCSVVALLIFWFSAPLSKLHFSIWHSRAEMEDPVLIQRIRKNYLIPPLTKTANSTAIDYNFQNCTEKINATAFASIDYNPSCGQVQKVQDILSSLSPGFFVECGANDGCFTSNTLWLERKLGWTGLLVEADPNVWRKLISVHRKAWPINTCVSTETRPLNTTFYLHPKTGLASGLKKSAIYNAVEPFSMECLPLYSILLALNRTTVDFFSLDVEGNELDILNTIPFDKITFKVLSIEHLLIPNGKEVIRNFMESKGYIFYGTVIKIINKEASCAGDSIYLHPSLNLTKEQRSKIGHEDLKPVLQTPR